MELVKVFSNRNGKSGVAKKTPEGNWLVSLEGDEFREIKPATFDRWYEIVEEESEIVKTENEVSAFDAPEITIEKHELTVEAPAHEEESLKLNGVSLTAELNEIALEIEEEIEAEEVESITTPELIEDHAPEVNEDQVTEDAPAEAEEAPVEETPVTKAEEEKAPKEKKEKTSKEDPSAKEKAKEFFTDLLVVINKRQPGYTKIKAREKNYLSFPAGVSGIKFKMYYTGNTLRHSLYFFHEQKVNDQLFNALSKYKNEINEKLSEYGLVWETSEDNKHRKIYAEYTNFDKHELVVWGAKAVMRFKEVFTPYLEIVMNELSKVTN